uniref:Uncharacterized protein n=1 Tax=Tetranychus urticae TaxID=32264 RepID=T1K1W5_TETUR
MGFCLLILLVFSIGFKEIVGQEGPKVAPFTYHVKPVIGGSTSFLCQKLSGSSLLQITWYKDGKEIQDSSDIKIGTIQESSILRIDSIKSSHSGNYTCKIANRYGHDSYTAELLVEGPPNWIEKPNNVKSKVHSMINTHCLVSGYPKPTITWKKLQGSSWIQLESNGQHNHNLQIMNATKSHEGRYGCSASNGIEPDLWSEFDISIEGPKVAPFSSTVKPVIGSKTSFFCQSLSGTPPLQIFWIKDGNELRDSTETRIRNLEDSSVLHIDSIKSSHSGNYTCRISNRYGHDSYTAELIVEGPPNWIEKPNNVKSRVHQMINVRCLVSGYPKPTITWKKLQGSSWTQFETNSQHKHDLQIMNATKSHEGRYGCSASNGIEPDLWSEFDISIEGPKVSLFSSNVKPVVGGKLTFICQSLAGSSPFQITWSKDGEELKNPSDIRIGAIQDSSMLIIDSIKSSHSGNYTCKISNRHGSDSHSSELLVEGSPSWIENPTDIKLKIGQTVNVKCLVSSYPRSKVVWKRLEGSSWNLIESNNMKTVDYDISNNNLMIHNATRYHEGRYGCSASNGIEPNLWSEFDISIEGRPNIEPFSFPNEVKLNQPILVVTCVVSNGEKPIKFEWFKDGNPMESKDEVNIKHHEMYSFLELKNLKSKHIGNYTCLARNRFGTDSFTSKLLMKVPPFWTKEPVDVKVSAGSKLVVDCLANGYPIPKIYWRLIKNNQVVNQINSSSLIFESISLSNRGNYECVAENSVGFPISKTIYIEVVAEGDKPLTIKWSKDSVLLNKSGYQRYTITDSPTTDGLKSVLTVRSADLVDDGSYLCVAENEFGKDERNIRVTIIEAPPAPQNLQIRQTWSRSVSLNWAPPASNALPILGYIVRYWKITGQGQNERLREINVSLPMNSVLINALEPSCLYEAEIIAVNEVGPGQPSRTIKFETGEEEPTGAPIDLQAIARGPTTIRVSWKPPTKDKWNGKILGYYVGYRRAGDFKSPHSFKTVDAASHNNTYEYLITSLVKGTAYSITIKAYNSAGNGPEHQEIIVETLLGNVPPAPRFKVLSATSDSLNLRYNIVPDSAPVQLLQLHFKELSDLDWNELALTYEGKDTNEYTLTNLNPSTVYKLYVTASNEHGISDPSQMITAKTARSLNDLSSISGPFDSTSLLGPGSSSFGEMVYFPAITISIASIIIVIVIAFVFVKKARLDASAKSNFEFCQASQTGILAHNRATGTTFGTVQRFVDHDKTMSLVTTGPCDDAYNGQLPTPYSKIPIGTEKRNSTLTDNRHFYDYPQ